MLKDGSESVMSEHLYYFLQQLLNGLTIGCTYALIAMALPNRV
jgi:hypothetical protein